MEVDSLLGPLPGPSVAQERRRRRRRDLEAQLPGSPSSSDDEDEDDTSTHIREGGEAPAFVFPDKEKELPGELYHMFLLVVLYFLQGVPVGLAFGSVPFLLQSRASYSQIGIFSFATYPYSLKLVWSPIVDSLFLHRVGRRKSWIIPMQILAGCFLFCLSFFVDDLIGAEHVEIAKLTLVFWLLIVVTATQDIAVDGWALTLLCRKNLGYAATCQTIGLNMGYMLSFTVFLALNSPDFCNSYLRTVPSDEGIFLLSGYVRFWGIVYWLVTLFMVVPQAEAPFSLRKGEGKLTVASVYRTMWKLVQQPSLMTLIVVLLISKLGFAANDAALALKLMERGVPRANVALIALIDFPFEILYSFLAAKWSRGDRPLRAWTICYSLKTVLVGVSPFVLVFFPTNGATLGYYTLILVGTLATAFCSTVMWVSWGAFFARISDPAIGGTYLTLLNTTNNFGGTWPRFFVLAAIDFFTVKSCYATDGSSLPFQCGNDAASSPCLAKGGTCRTIRDGFYPVAWSCFVIGAVLMITFLRRQLAYLQQTKESDWRLMPSVNVRLARLGLRWRHIVRNDL